MTPSGIYLHKRKPLEERFWSKVNRDGLVPSYKPELGPCWIWSGLLKKGYGSFFIRSVGHRSIGRRSIRRPAHQVSYEMLVGPIPNGKELDHLCRVPACVNPSHLEPVTHGENNRRGHALRTHCKYGHPLQMSKYGWRNCPICRIITNMYRIGVDRRGSRGAKKRANSFYSAKTARRLRRKK